MIFAANNARCPALADIGARRAFSLLQRVVRFLSGPGKRDLA